jgi:predicted nuclease of predicted toxin-antitoxin system
MRFLVDENMGPSVARWLVSQGHEVFSVYDEAQGIADEDILQKAHAEDYIVISCDKDFGELIFRKGLPHKGVLLFRLNDESIASKIRFLDQVLSEYSEVIKGKFAVVTESSVRII